MKLKSCKVCGKTLHCMECGERVTPERKEKKREHFRIAMTMTQKNTLEQLANAADVTMSKLVFSLLYTHFGNLNGIGKIEAFAEYNKMNIKDYIRSMIGVD